MPNTKISTEQYEKYRKLGGWLLVLIIGHSVGIITTLPGLITNATVNNVATEYTIIDSVILGFRIVSLIMIGIRFRRAREVYVSRIALELIIYITVGLYLGSIAYMTSQIISTISAGVAWIIYLYQSMRVKVYLGLISGNSAVPYAVTQIVLSEDISDYANDQDPDEEARVKLLEKMKSQSVDNALKK